MPGKSRHPVHARLEQLKPQLIEFTKEFCRIATVNPPGNRYLECCRFLERKLKRLGLKTKILRVPASVQRKLVPGLDTYPRYNILARWNTGAKKTLLLTGHYDVVPPTAGWKSDPFKPFVKGARLIGRGTGDMKACDAAAIFAVQAMRETGARPPWNIELAFTCDEETGGYAGLGHVVKSGAVKPDAAVLLEGGSGDTIGYAHRGVLWLEVTVHGKAGHASNPKNGVNALEKACGLIREFKKLERVYAGRRSAFRANKVARRPTLMIGGVSGGGGKINTIPDTFTFSIDRRLLPEENVAAVKREFMQRIRRAKAKDRDLKVSVAYPLFVESGSTNPKAKIVRAAQEAHRAVTGKRSTLRMSGGFTDMHWLTNDGKVPTVGYGVSGGGAHSDLEWADTAGMLQAAKIYAEIALRMK
ncbi:MAG: ArgE/DapE family deacylase [Planctomycetes bacterium]|nr:ArgE/DapE family deacylase [Planctomycetota bacterium]